MHLIFKHLKYMKNLVSFFILLFPLLLVGQSFVQPQPKIWLRADSIQSLDQNWSDETINLNNANVGDLQLFHQVEYLNYNRSIKFDNSQTLSIDSLFLDSKDVTAIIVYKTDSLTEEQSLWKLLTDTNSIGLTTKKIKGTDVSIKYGTTNKQGVIINSLTQSIEFADSVNYSSIQIGKGYDDCLKGKVSEFIFFNKKLSNPEIIQQMSYLAIKYGVTLQKTDYISTDSTTIWNYTDYPQFSASILGIGRDDDMGLNQKQSSGIDNKVIFGLGSEFITNDANSNVIPNETFIIIGFDTTGLKTQYELQIGTGEIFNAYGKGMVQCTGTTIYNYNTFLKVDVKNWEGNLIDYKLIIDGNADGIYTPQNISIYYPDSLTADSILCFSNVVWDNNLSGKDCFSFITLSEDEIDRLTEVSPLLKIIGDNDIQNNTISNQNNSNTNNSEFGNRYGLYPNPTTEKFTVWAEYVNTSKVEVILFSSDGKKLQVWTGSDAKNYKFNGTLTTPGNYLIEIKSDKETKTIKMIVQ